MKNIKFVILPLLLIMVNCNNTDDKEGTYYKQSDDCMGGASYIQFKEGYYYNGITKSAMRFKYKVEKNKIVVENHGTQIVFNIIDDNTIEFMGCKYKKGEDKTNVEKEATIETTNNTIEQKNKTQNFDLSKDIYENESAIIKDIFNVENDIYIVVDVIKVEYTEDMNIEIINENSKLRTYKAVLNVLIKDIQCMEASTSKYLIDNKERIISPNLSFVLISTNNKGELSNLNLGCWN